MALSTIYANSTPTTIDLDGDGNITAEEILGGGGTGRMLARVQLIGIDRGRCVIACNARSQAGAWEPVGGIWFDYIQSMQTSIMPGWLA